MTNQELVLLKNFEEDSLWFNRNIEEIRKEGFTKKFVAIKGKQILEGNENIDFLIQQLEKKGENPSFIFIGFVYPKGFTLIL